MPAAFFEILIKLKLHNSSADTTMPFTHQPVRKATGNHLDYESMHMRSILQRNSVPVKQDSCSELCCDFCQSKLSRA